jgi:hypothetical protein
MYLYWCHSTNILTALSVSVISCYEGLQTWHCCSWSGSYPVRSQFTSSFSRCDGML